MKKGNHLLPAISMSLIATPMHGSIRKFVNALIRNDAEVVLRPRLARRTETPAFSRI
jgi:uncharacterized membrane protein YbjE (DUF340 family)